MLLNNTLNAFGLDIGDESVKAVQLEQKRTFRGKRRLFLRAYGEIRVPKGIIVNGEIKNLEKLTFCISELLKKTKIKSRTVVASLPEKKSFLQLLEINALNEKNLEAGLPKILERYFPTPYKEIYLDWQIISKKPAEHMFRYKVLVGAILRKTADSFTELLESLNLTPLALEIEGVAIARSALGSALSAQGWSATSRKNTNLIRAIIDIGATCSNIVFTQNNIPTLSLNLPVSGNAMTKIISESLKLSASEAEKTKIKCGLDLKLCQGKLRPVLSFIINDMAKKIQKGLDFYKTSMGENNITEIYLSGGGANLSKLDSVLSQKLKIKVRKADTLIGIKTKDINIQKVAAKYAVAIGLAIRGAISPLL